MEKRLVTATATRDARITRAKERNGPALEWLAVSKRRGRRSFVLVAPKIKSTGRTVEREQQKNARGRLRCSLFFQRHLFVDVIAEATPTRGRANNKTSFLLFLHAVIGSDSAV